MKEYLLTSADRPDIDASLRKKVQDVVEQSKGEVVDDQGPAMHVRVPETARRVLGELKGLGLVVEDYQPLVFGDDPAAIWQAAEKKEYSIMLSKDAIQSAARGLASSFDEAVGGKWREARELIVRDGGEVLMDGKFAKTVTLSEEGAREMGALLKGHAIVAPLQPAELHLGGSDNMLGGRCPAPGSMFGKRQ